MMAPENEQLANELDRILDGLFGRRLVLLTTPRSFPWAVRATLFSIGLVALTMGAGALAGEPRVFRQVDVWAGLLLLVTLIAYSRLADEVKRLSRTEIIPELSAEVAARARSFGASHFLLKWQALICLGVGLLTAAPLFVALRLFSTQQAPATLALVALGSAAVTSLVYIPASVSVLSLLARQSRVALYPLDPTRTRFVDAILTLSQHTVIVSAAMGTVGALGPLLLPGLGPVAYVLSGLVLLGAVMASLTQYVVQQYALGALFARTRSETLSALQAEIAPLFARRTDLSANERSALTQLLSLYDRVAAASLKVFTARQALRFASPLVVPLLTMALSTLHIDIPERSVIWVLLRQVLKS